MAFTRISLTTIKLSWAVFGLSFFLPTTNILHWSGAAPGAPLLGWQAFTASMVNGVMNPWLWIIEPKVFLFLLFPLANGLMFLSPWLAYFFRDELIHFASFFLLFAVVPWCIPDSLLGDVFIGFYCWNGSFFTMSLGYLLSHYAYLIRDN